jgi:hypothetical protein
MKTGFMRQTRHGPGARVAAHVDALELGLLCGGLKGEVFCPGRTDLVELSSHARDGNHPVLRSAQVVTAPAVDALAPDAQDHLEAIQNRFALRACTAFSDDNALNQFEPPPPKRYSPSPSLSARLAGSFTR